MKKTLNVVLAVAMAFAMFACFAFVAAPSKSGEYQISLSSVKAVDVQNATAGVRSYADLVDTTRGYQVNEVIHIAVTAEVKNIEESGNRSLKSISGKEIDVVVGSSNIDFSYAKYSSPSLLAHVWNGYSQANVATLGYVMAAAEVLEYDAAKNEISWTYKGFSQYAMTNNSSTTLNLVVFNPGVDSDGNIMIPALKLKEQDTKWQIGSSTFETKYQAPKSVSYTMVLTGVTKDNAGATTGSFYAKILVTGAEKFEDYKTYYVASDTGAWSTSKPSGTEYVDYVTVEVEELEMKSGYNVYKYFVPGYATSASTPIVYFGDDDDYDDLTLASVNPNLFDNAANKASFSAAGLNGTTPLSVAGGVKTQSSTFEYFNSSSKLTVPLSSVVYTTNNRYYAPGFYGGTYSEGASATNRTHSSTTAATEVSSVVGSSTETVVDTYYLQLSAAEATTFNVANIKFYEADKLVTDANTIAVYDSGSVYADSTSWSGNDAGTGPFNYTVNWVDNGAGRLVTIQVLESTAYAYPLSTRALTSDEADSQNQFVVFYEADKNNCISSSYLPMSTTWRLIDTTGTDLGVAAPIADDTEKTYYPVFAETTKSIVTNNTTGGFQVSNMTVDTQPNLYLTSADLYSVSDITNIYWGYKDVNGKWVDGYSVENSKERRNVYAANAVPATDKLAEGDIKATITVTADDYNNRPVVTISDLSVYDVAKGWVSLKNASSMFGALKNIYGKDTNAAQFVLSITVKSGTAIVASWSGGAGNDADVIGRNGIATYVICTTDGEPLVALATEETYFESDTGYGIAMFDAHNFGNLGTRIFRANSTNLTYTGTGTFVSDSAAMIRGLNYFGLDASFGTTYKVLESAFEDKAAGAVYSENVTSDFKYGTLQEIGFEQVEEETVPNEVDDEGETDIDDGEGDDGGEEDVPGETEPPVETDVTPVVKTGDTSVNVAVALAAAALIATAGLAFVMKKVR